MGSWIKNSVSVFIEKKMRIELIGRHAVIHCVQMGSPDYDFRWPGTLSLDLVMGILDESGLRLLRHELQLLVSCPAPRRGKLLGMNIYQIILL